MTELKTDQELIALIPAWLEFSQEVRPHLGMSRARAVNAAYQLYEVLGVDDGCAQALATGNDFRDVLCALTFEVLPAKLSPANVCKADALYRLISGLPWHDDELSEKRDLLGATAASAWRAIGTSPGELRRLRKNCGDPYLPVGAGTALTSSAIIIRIEAAERSLTDLASLMLSDQKRAAADRSLKFLFETCHCLARLADYSARLTRAHSVKLWDQLTAAPHVGLFDERAFFLAELARIAAQAALGCGRSDESESWLHRAEAAFAATWEPNAGLAKIAYSRLRFFYYRRRYQDVLESARTLADTFERLGMPMQAAKTRLVEALSLKVMGRFDDAIPALSTLELSEVAKATPEFRICVKTHLGDSYKEQGRFSEASRALAEAVESAPESAGSLMVIDLLNVLADLLRMQGKLDEAAELFRRAKATYVLKDAIELGAYTAVLLAETYLMHGRLSEAEEELRWALPILEENEMLPERGMAVALLQESIRQRHTRPDVFRVFFEKAGLKG